ncbi:MAG TPA: hypothetical protein GYA05_05620 [Acholeplasmataceae bacterium]|nr:hypothetical protein [Acholeplasmataceae bacterium]
MQTEQTQKQGRILEFKDGDSSGFGINNPFFFLSENKKDDFLALDLDFPDLLVQILPRRPEQDVPVAANRSGVESFFNCNFLSQTFQDSFFKPRFQPTEPPVQGTDIIKQELVPDDPLDSRFDRKRSANILPQMIEAEVEMPAETGKGNVFEKTTSCPNLACASASIFLILSFSSPPVR